MIDGVISNGKEQVWIDEENKAGIKQLVYNSIQGSEYLFPNYFPTRYRNVEIKGNLYGASVSSENVIKRGANLIGSFTAAWDDSGLHNELFWLGWVTGTQYAWSVGKPTLEQTIADFMDVFYGYGSNDMVEIYRLLQKGARFYQDLWDRVISKERNPGYGDWFGKGKGTERYDQVVMKLKAIWEKSQFEKGRSTNGRDFVHILDDLKDHLADRRVGLEYMFAPFERMEIPEWQKQLMAVIVDIATTHNLEVKGIEEKPLNE